MFPLKFVINDANIKAISLFSLNPVSFCFVCFISTILGTNSLNSADVPLNTKQNIQTATYHPYSTMIYHPYMTASYHPYSTMIYHPYTTVIKHCESITE